MARGNQRERDRERAQARGNHKPKQPKSDGLTPEQRRERDARALQEKAARKAGQSMGGGNHDHFLGVGGKIKNGYYKRTVKKMRKTSSSLVVKGYVFLLR